MGLTRKPEYKVIKALNTKIRTEIIEQRMLDGTYCPINFKE